MIKKVKIHLKVYAHEQVAETYDSFKSNGIHQAVDAISKPKINLEPQGISNILLLFKY